MTWVIVLPFGKYVILTVSLNICRPCRTTLVCVTVVGRLLFICRPRYLRGYSLWPLTCSVAATGVAADDLSAAGTYITAAKTASEIVNSFFIPLLLLVDSSIFYDIWYLHRNDRTLTIRQPLHTKCPDECKCLIYLHLQASGPGWMSNTQITNRVTTVVILNH
jgi:hypothetical protein